VAPKTPNARSRIKAALDRPRDRIVGCSLGRRCSQPRAILGLLVGIALLMATTAANALDATIPKADFPASEGCCGTEDQDYTFRGYTVELWDEAPTVSELNCPNQDDGCLLNEADQLSRVYHLQEALVLIVFGQESYNKTTGDQRVGEILGCFLIRELGGFPLAVVRAAMDDVHLGILRGLT
jgi:hypothetical protein